uniref:3-phosphoinositide-dependent protein kinase 1 n=1 Tax=Strigamia maritima TaxID=126957 RepID=T1JHU9_STRMM
MADDFPSKQMGSVISCYTKCDSTDQAQMKTSINSETKNNSPIECTIKKDSSPLVNGSIVKQVVDQSTSVPSSTTKKQRDKDYIFGKVIGEGSFSTVFLVKDIRNEKQYAMKVCDKDLLLRERKSEYVKREREALCRVNLNLCPFIIKLYATFQDESRLYFVLSYAKHGELLPIINKVGSFNEECTKFYAAELIVALEHIHRLKLIHRDIKPENILLNEDMHIQLGDFGSVKIQGLDSDDRFKEASRRNSFVGTAQYVAPEILTDKEQTKSVDLWSFGCTVYQMSSGYPPFRGLNEYLIFQKVMKLEYSYPDNFNSKIRDFIENFLVLEPLDRLGATDCDEDGYTSIKNHEFFDGLEWESLHLQLPPKIGALEENGAAASAGESNGSTDELFPSSLEPGLDERQISRLLGLELRDYDETADFGYGDKKPLGEIKSTKVYDYQQLLPEDISKVFDELDEWKRHQATDSWHERIGRNVILKMGLVGKRKGILPKPRILVLTTGPCLYYFNQGRDQPKGEIPWNPKLKAEAKNFKIFAVKTPSKNYYFEDHNHQSQVWCDWINNLHKIYHPPT